MKIKRFIASLLACAVIGGVLPYSSGVTENPAITVSAAEEYTEGTYESLMYLKYSDHVEIYGCDKSVTEVVIPSEIEGLPVTSIGEYSFFNFADLTSITIPDSVTSIGVSAFNDCSGLTSITIPDSVTSIGGFAFNDTPWLDSQRKISPLVIINNILIDGQTCEGDIVIPDNVTSIGIYAFVACSGLTSVEIPDSVTSIGNRAFCDCSGLTSITIPNSVTIIGDWAFDGCSGLTSITIPDSVASIGDSAFYGCEKLTSITINNSECEIYNSQYTFTNESDCLTATIYGYENSTAQAYAEKYGRNFVSLGEAPTTTTPETTLSGDADLDGKVGISDVVKVMMYVANKEANPLSEQGLINADVYSSGDGVFISDALSIQKKVAQIIDTLPES